MTPKIDKREYEIILETLVIIYKIEDILKSRILNKNQNDRLNKLHNILKAYRKECLEKDRDLILELEQSEMER